MTERAHYFHPFPEETAAALKPQRFREPLPELLSELPPPARLPTLEAPEDESFENARAQFPNAAVHADAIRMGTWLVVLGSAIAFGGLLTVYAVVRALHPELFVYGGYFMDPRAGTVATYVLLAASLTATLAVRYARERQRRELVLSAAATVTLGLLFLGLQVAEYSGKVEQRLLPGSGFSPTREVWETPRFMRAHPVAAEHAANFRPRLLAETGVELAPPSGTTWLTREQLEPLFHAGALGEQAVLPDIPTRPRNAHGYFGLYYLLTGAHFLHVLAAVAAFGFVLIRARSSDADLPRVDAAALYLHFVGIVWLFLFPLFYLAS
jgi:cytochrome c oxidase subunit 3